MTKLLLISTILLSSNHYYGQGEVTELDKTRLDGMSVNKMWDHLECDALFALAPRPIHKEKDWDLMRTAYASIVSPEKSSLPSQEEDKKRSGFHVAFEAKQAKEKGRGIFAKEKIKKGQKVWSTLQTARFDDGNDYRKFIASIPVDLACDVLQWAYVQAIIEDSDREKPLISVDIDPGSFLNSFEDYSYEDYSHDEWGPNIGCDPDAAKDEPGGCRQNYFALRDIDADEELILDYGEFAISDGWRLFGLQGRDDFL